MASSLTAVTPTEIGAESSDALLVHLAPLAPEELEPALSHLVLAFPAQEVFVSLPAAPNFAGESSFHTLKLLTYTPHGSSEMSPLPTAADLLSLWKLVEENHATACIHLGPRFDTLQPAAIYALAATAFSADLAVARYRLGPHEGLFNSAILYPVTRALFGSCVRFPLALDLGFSARMVERLAAAASRYPALRQNETLLWPAAEAAMAGYSCAEVEIPVRSFPEPPAADLNTILTQIAGALFADIEAKATFWQRLRSTTPVQTTTHEAASDNLPDVAPMLDSFHLAYNNLHDLWAIVLPPQSLVDLKRLTALSADNFRMPDSLWARIIYDFALAYRLRSIHRGHLLGALTPLYLAWVASHLKLIRDGTAAEQHIEQLAQVFEADKPYLVSRWRWPDRFNP
ncbi:MAG: hypothetical protein FWD64_08100 [Acidobacteriaceae bacterium]|nr:hypothetical protein [Acidobacteriaceae bacterium]